MGKVQGYPGRNGDAPTKATSRIASGPQNSHNFDIIKDFASAEGQCTAVTPAAGTGRVLAGAGGSRSSSVYKP